MPNFMQELFAAAGIEMTPETRARMNKVENDFQHGCATPNNNQQADGHPCSAMCGERVLERGDVCWTCLTKERKSHLR